MYKEDRGNERGGKVDKRYLVVLKLVGKSKELGT